ncbi:MAG: hypothetical protein WC289_03430 [Patescibacteria group bacterium]|jgi:hypothetical protein
MKRVFFIIAFFAIAIGSYLVFSKQKDLCMAVYTQVQFATDSTQGILFPLTLQSMDTLWIDIPGRRTQRDTPEGLSTIQYADSGSVYYERSDEFETYQRFGSLPDTTTYVADLTEGLSMIRGRPSITVDSTGIRDTINGFCCNKFLMSYSNAEQNLTVELWITNEYHLDPWIRDTYGVGPPPPAFDGIPVKIICREDKQCTTMEIKAISYAPRPLNAYSIPPHFQYIP